jgi:hypothetical protein
LKKVAAVVITKNNTIQLNAAGTASIVVADITMAQLIIVGLRTLSLDKHHSVALMLVANTLL